TISPDGYILNTGAAFNAPAVSPGVDLAPYFKNTAGDSYESSAVSVGPDVPQKGYDPAGQNILLIGQFTTDGDFCFNLNVGARDKDGNPQLLIYSNDVVYDATEVIVPELTGCPKVIVDSNKLPMAMLTAPLSTAKVCKDSMLTVTATATDADGMVKKVEFFANNVSIGADTTAPYSITYKPLTVGNLDLKVVATDDKGGMSKDTATSKVTVDVKDCTITGIATLDASSSVVNMYPNPTTVGSEVKIEMSNLFSNNATITIVDILGREHFNKQVAVSNNAASMNLNVSDLSTGTYIVLIKTQTEVIAKKLVIEQ
ncbi:MAG TPA: Ig-like domain-containing protein, partial [Bacteroidia bacterium]|nr:Ig-like domain-containing protein [Bacteroidia bacterium]